MKQSLSAAAALCVALAVPSPLRAGPLTHPLAGPSPIPTAQKQVPRVDVPTPVYLAQPTNLRSTDQSANPLQTCKDHADPGSNLWGGFQCAAAMQNHSYVLVWDWSNAQCPRGSQCPAEIDGYRVYPLKPNQPPVTVAQGTRFTTQAFPAKSSACYAVTAFKGSEESLRTTTLCLTKTNASIPVQIGNLHIQLPVANERSSEKHKDTGTGLLSTLLENPLSGHTSWNGPFLFVGYAYATQKHLLGDQSDNDLWRAAVNFDVGAVSGRHIVLALLGLHVQNSDVGDTYTNLPSASCIAQVGTGTIDWWDYTTWIDGNWFKTLSRDAGPNVSVDVTDQVAQWAQGAKNYGFVLKGSDENLNAFTEDSCLSTLSDASLQVTYY
ncbi:MAG: hypothetical protein NVS3B28_26920 [Candidatus Velthaea sp.]